MNEARPDTSFGAVRIRAAREAAGPIGPAQVDLPRGLSVGDCRAGVLEGPFGAGETVEIVFACDLIPGATAYPGNGEMPAAWEAEAPGLRGRFAIRDLDWFEDRHEMKAVS